MNFSDQGEKAFAAQMAAYKQQLEDECDRIESAENVGTPQEVTPIQVRRASDNLRYLPPRRKRGFNDVVAILATPIAALLGGLAINNYKSGWGIVGIVVAVIVVCISEVYKYIREDR